jgi:hypothetical protein
MGIGNILELKISAALEIPSAGFGYQPSSKLGRFSDPFLFHTWNSAGDYQYSNSLAGDHRIDATNARIDTPQCWTYAGVSGIWLKGSTIQIRE